MSKVTFKPGTMLNPVPVVMVTMGKNQEEHNIITVAWTGIVNSEPPLLYISVRKSRYSHELLMRNREFVVNLTTEALALATDYCGVKSGRDVDKFKETGLTPIPADVVNCPMIAEAPVNLECKVMDVREFPSHDMFLAEIVAVHGDSQLLSENGKLLLERAGLICYSHGEYFKLEKSPLGKFGYSIMKPKTKRRLEKEEKARKRSQSRRASGSSSAAGKRGGKTGVKTPTK